jgi:hypothetical protein
MTHLSLGRAQWRARLWVQDHLGKILTIDNLRHHHIVVLDWCCMCKSAGESVDHLLLHCIIAHEMWSMLFGLFGISWVIPRNVLGLLDCWQGKFGRHRNWGAWHAVLHYLMWCLWQERNGQKFEDRERSIVELKLLFFRTLFEWVSVRGVLSCGSLHQFLDVCSLRACFVCNSSILGFFLFLIKFILIYQKIKK